jgi:SAM-dependent methyltransferase
VERLRPRRLLDVGAGFQTALFRDLLGAGAVEVLGLWVPRFAPPDGAGDHHVADLNEADWPELGPYETVVAAEVIEHLFQPPAEVVRRLGAYLAPGGHLVLQTPNAAALHKRLRLLAGRAPFGPAPEDRSGDAHVREYTLAELHAAGRVAGLEPVESVAASYFGSVPAAADRLLPPRLRLGLTVTFRRP